MTTQPRTFITLLVMTGTMLIAPLVSAVPLSKPVADPAAGPENETSLLAVEADPRAMWYQFLLQRDGKLVFSTWHRVDDLELFVGVYFVTRNLGAGNYKFWARAYEPSVGTSPWSDEAPFTVECTEIADHNDLHYPIDDTEPGFWPQEFVFSDPASVLNTTATWGQVGVSHHDPVTDDFLEPIDYPWVEYDYPGQNGVQIEDVGNLIVDLDGLADWDCREYSPCSGSGEFGTVAVCDVSEVTCDGAPAPTGIAFTMESFYHKATETADVGSTPELAVEFYGVPWVQIRISNVATGKVAYEKWIRFTEIESFNENMPKLPPGDYEFRTRSFHHSCGTGPWSPAQLTRTVLPVEPVALVYQVQTDQRGVSYSAFPVQPGVDWHQFYVTSGTKVVLNQWFDLEKEWTEVAGVREREDGVYPAYYSDADAQAGQRIDGDYILKLNQAYSGPMTVWMRSYSNSGTYSDWVKVDGFQNLFTGAAPINLVENGGGGVDWDDPGDNYGQYEVYFQRNGKLYFTDFVDANFLSPNDFALGYVDEWELPDGYTPFFDLPDGEYNVWVRNVVGTSKGAWSTPITFSRVPDP